MNQDQYLQRLKSIREKYTTNSKYSVDGKSNEMNFKPLPNPELNIPYQRFQMTPNRSKAANYEQSKYTAPRPERSCSVVEKSIVVPQYNEKYNAGGYEACNKRMANFSIFIKDLDQRIEEKERVLSSRYKNSQRSTKNKEDIEYEVTQTLNRYNSSKDFPKHILEPSRVVPRQAYQKSLQKRQEFQSRRMSNHDMENVLQRKWAQDNYSNQKLKIVNGFRDNKLKINQYTTPLGISKNENLPGNDQWSIGKLDNIQQRIKNVLQRANH